MPRNSSLNTSPEDVVILFRTHSVEVTGPDIQSILGRLQLSATATIEPANAAPPPTTESHRKGRKWTAAQRKAASERARKAVLAKKAPKHAKAMPAVA